MPNGKLVRIYIIMVAKNVYRKVQRFVNQNVLCTLSWLVGVYWHDSQCDLGHWGVTKIVSVVNYFAR